MIQEGSKHLFVVTCLGVFSGTHEELRKKACSLALEYGVYKCQHQNEETVPVDIVDKLEASNTIYRSIQIAESRKKSERKKSESN